MMEAIDSDKWVVAFDGLRVVAGWKTTVLPPFAEKESASASPIWPPPQGYVVLETKLTRVDESGEFTRSVSTIPGGLELVTESVVNSAYDEMISSTVTTEDGTYTDLLKSKKASHLDELHKYESNDNIVQVDITAKGTGNAVDQKRSWVEVKVEVRLLYLGSNNKQELIQEIQGAIGPIPSLVKPPLVSPAIPAKPNKRIVVISSAIERVEYFIDGSSTWNIYLASGSVEGHGNPVLVRNVPEAIASLASDAARLNAGSFTLHIEDVYISGSGYDITSFVDAPVQFLPEQ